ncbi:hypothetical protein GCM10009557_09970 [Virgisporangium ochraceum]|uniref:Uncharacterized protein n=1 Tax=Virgisporangium ochraceum TaxID=65505 RepID=A0A8J3ZX95_9ACTN|nr:hypothetical protein [Virgisporangium ochraceum]GIJ71296.1 hypothetical protein Voc01_062130 [Virgisporangium ochraceum]
MAINRVRAADVRLFDRAVLTFGAAVAGGRDLLRSPGALAFVATSGAAISGYGRRRYTGSLAGCDVRMVRLTADVDTVRERLRRRDTGAKLERHLRALDGPASTGVEDFTVTNDRPPVDVATDILARPHWM